MKTYSSIVLVVGCLAAGACSSKDKGGSGSGSDGSGATTSTDGPATATNSGSGSGSTATSMGGTNSGSGGSSGGSGTGGETSAGGSGGTSNATGGSGGDAPGGAGGEGGDPGEEQPVTTAAQACQAFYDALEALAPEDCTAVHDMIADDGCMQIFQTANYQNCEENFVAWHLCLAGSDDIVIATGTAGCRFTTMVAECNDLRMAATTCN